MLLAVTLVTADPAVLSAAQERLQWALDAHGGVLSEAVLLGPNAVDFQMEAEDPAPVREAAEEALLGLAADVCVQPANGRRKMLLVADMDSTIIGCECIDELADLVGLKDKVSAITERAMRGEIDFEGALRERVAMLAGLPLGDLQRCYDDRVRLNSGARTLVRTMAAHGAKAFLVSGGFTFFTQRVAEAAGFHATRANVLLDDGVVLNGAVADPILGREAKLVALEEEAALAGLALSQTLAVGDGANDLMMIQASGLGVAYRAKPVVAAQAGARVDHADLTALLYFQGYSLEDFAPD
jgi:phosphoserine phosphatase